MFVEVKAEDDALGPLVVGIRDGAVAFLPSGVPNLQLHLAPAVVDRPETKVDPYSGRVVFNKVIVSESNEQTRFAYA